jgi:hypothetical protein
MKKGCELAAFLITENAFIIFLYPIFLLKKGSLNGISS